LKVCSVCNLSKEENQYHRRSDRPIGLRAACMVCERNRSKRDKERFKEKRTAARLSKHSDILYRLYRSCKHSALRRGIQFTIKPEDIKLTTSCPYLGVEFTNILGKGYQDYNPSVDRVNNTLGYIPGNVRLISVLANRMKHTATIEELQKFAMGVLENHPVS
jgi:hypothetical protein